MFKRTNHKAHLILALVFFSISVFMSVSYYFKIEDGAADTLTKVAFYFWLVSIVAWSVKAVFEIRSLRKKADGTDIQ